MKMIRCMRSLILIVFLTLLLFSCGRSEPVSSGEPSSTPISEPSLESISDTEPLPTVSRSHISFGGRVLDYEYLYEEGRDRDWEEDVLYLAEAFLRREPRLTKIANTYEFNGRIIRSTDEFYDPELRESFIDAIELLISRISELSDIEILYELQRIVVTLNDAHSRIFLPDEVCFPVNFVEMFEDDGVSLYVVTVPSTEEFLLWGKLESINGVPTEDILSRLGAYQSSENIYGEIYDISISYALVSQRDALAAVSVVEQDASTAEFTVSFDDGTILSAELFVYSTEEGWPERTDVRMRSSGGLMYEDFDLDYWMKYIPEDNIVYARMNYVIERSDLPYISFWDEIIHAIDDAPQPPKVVLDLRENPGGMYPIRSLDNFTDSLNNVDKEGVYVLIDNGIFSSGVALASDLRQKIENAVLVGLPTGEPVNTFGPSSGSTGIGFGGSYWVLPNSGYYFVVSDKLYVSWPDYEDEALMPDIEVRPTIEDYRQGVDTILEAVINM